MLKKGRGWVRKGSLETTRCIRRVNVVTTVVVQTETGLGLQVTEETFKELTLRHVTDRSLKVSTDTPALGGPPRGAKTQLRLQRPEFEVFWPNTSGECT